MNTDVAVRYICGNTAHPDHRVICRFRTENREGFKEVFTKVLVMAREMGHFKEGREYQCRRNEAVRGQARRGELQTSGRDDRGNGEGSSKTDSEGGRSGQPAFGRGVKP
ncbi:MAG: transposase [Treponema sp.]|nr:transposase [Treponema sp.]